MLVANIKICKSHLNIREGSDYTACCIHTSTLMSTLVRTGNNKRRALLKHAVCKYARS